MKILKQKIKYTLVFLKKIVMYTPKHFQRVKKKKSMIFLQNKN